MDFTFNKEDMAFQQEVRDFMKKELPEDWPGIPWVGEPAKETKDSLAFARNFTEKMRVKGWLTMHWPKEYGGEDAPLSKRVIFAREIGYWKAPQLDIYGPSIVGETLINFGTEEQKKEHLPLILNGNVLWTQGFSEPDAGSDLASLRTSAVEKGEYFIVNGQKTWTSAAHHADWMFLLVRTDPDAQSKHKGISLLYTDIKTPGITPRPLLNIAGGHTFNEVFLDNVKIPKNNLIGKKNDGFRYAMATLDYERSSSVKMIGSMERRLEDLVGFVNQERAKGSNRTNEHLVNERLAKLATDIEVAKLLAYRVVHQDAKGKPVTWEASMLFAFYADLMKRLCRVGTQILGPYGQLGPDSQYALLHGMEQSGYLYTPAYSLAGGTTEIQRNIVAWRGLGLPRA
ncbi:MAG: acyl-CoA dehydrogenase family protein [Desulfobacterium sp.]